MGGYGTMRKWKSTVNRLVQFMFENCMNIIMDIRQRDYTFIALYTIAQKYVGNEVTDKPWYGLWATYHIALRLNP